MLNVDCDVDIFCLHYTVFTLLSVSSTQWIETWNHHPLSTERNKSPVQLFEEGLRLLEMRWEDEGGNTPEELQRVTIKNTIC
jgi:hypothetical protein